MSGIVGIVHFDGRPVEPGLVEAMTKTIDYRGPDGINHWHSANAAFGQCMLRTTPESLEETQPLVSQDRRFVLVMDGRVDNWEELRRELLGAGAQLRTRADAELVLHSFMQWGRDCVARIDGDFAFAIWDTRTREFFCARDRFGNKPFHYYWNGTTFAFASDLRPIVDLPWVNRTLNEGMVAEFLASEWYSHDETFWQGILRLPAAHRLSITATGAKLDRYWEPDLFATLPCKSDDDYIEYYRELLFDVVRRCSRTHRPIACEVSGGLDSSAIFAVADRLEKTNRLLAPGIEGYTLDFTGDPYADELEYARAVGAHLGRAIHEIKPASPPLSWYTERAQKLLDFPDYPHGAMGLSIIEGAKSNGCRALWSGTGGDEWLGGDRSLYIEAWQNRSRESWFAFLASERESLGWRKALWHATRHGILPTAPEFIKQIAQRLRGQSQCRKRSFEWVSPALRALLETREAQGKAISPINVARASQRRLHDLLRYPYAYFSREWNERRCALLGVEWRQPLMSRQIVEFAFAAPERFRLRTGVDRWLHRNALGDLLPTAVLKRTTKSEFTVAFERYWRELETQTREHLSEFGNRWVNDTSFPGLLAAGIRHHSGGWHSGSIWALVALDRLLRKGLATAATNYPPRRSDVITPIHDIRHRS